MGLLLSLLMSATACGSVDACRDACDAGGAAACTELARYALDNKGEPPSFAPRHFERACNLGHAPGCRGLGQLLFAGRHIDKDEGDAAVYLKRACNLGDLEACVDVLRLAPQNNQHAVDVFRKVADACSRRGGSPEACEIAGRFALWGVGGPANRNGAIGFFEKACQASLAASCQALRALRGQAGESTLPPDDFSVPGVASGTTGTLRVESARGGVVVVDGLIAGPAPLSIPVPSGTHQVRVFVNGKPMLAQDVALPANGTRTLAVVGPAKLRLSAQPATAALQLDGQPVKPGTVDVEPGEHTVTATATGYLPASEDVSCVGDSTCEATLTLKLAPKKVKVESSPAGATVSVAGARVGVTPCDVDLELGKHTLSFSLTGYEPQELTVQVAANATAPVNAKLKQLVGKTVVVVTSSPPGARVANGAEALGVTPLEVALMPGRYALTFELEQHQRASASVQVPAAARFEAPVVKLTALPLALSISTSPAGATLKLDGKTVGKSPWTGTTTPGPHTVTAEKPGHKTATDTVTAPGEVSLELEPLPTSLRLTLTPALDPALVRVTLDGASVAVADGPFAAEPGVHEFEATALGFEPASVKATAKQGASTAVSLKLKKVTGKQGASIVTTPAGAKVQLDGFPAGTTPLDINLSVGEHTVALELDGHLPSSSKFEVKKGAQTPVQRTLSARGVALSIAATPSNARVSLNGSYRGTAPLSLELSPGEHRVVVERDGYITVDEVRTLDPGRSASWSFELREVPPPTPVSAPPPPPVELAVATPDAGPIDAGVVAPEEPADEARRVLADVAATLDAKRAVLRARAEKQLDLSDLVAVTAPVEARTALCVEFRAKVQTTSVRAVGVDSFGNESRAAFLVNGTQVGTLPFVGAVPSCAERLEARDDAGNTVQAPVSKLTSGGHQELQFTFPGRQRRVVLSLLGETTFAPLLPFGNTMLNAIRADVQPINFAGGLRLDLWGQLFHFSLAGRATTMFRRALFNDRSAPVVPVADLYVGLGATAGSDAVRYRFAFDVGVWSLICPSVRLSNALSFSEKFFITLNADSAFVPLLLVPDFPPGSAFQLYQLFVFSGSLSIGYGW